MCLGHFAVKYDYAFFIKHDEFFALINHDFYDGKSFEILAISKIDFFRMFFHLWTIIVGMLWLCLYHVNAAGCLKLTLTDQGYTLSGFIFRISGILAINLNEAEKTVFS